MSARHTTKYAVGRCAFILNDNITSSSSLYAKCKCTCVRTCAWCSCNQEIIFIVSSTKIPGLKFIRAVSRYTNKPYKYVALYPYQSGGGIHASPRGFCKLKSILAFSSQFGSDLWRQLNTLLAIESRPISQAFTILFHPRVQCLSLCYELT